MSCSCEPGTNVPQPHPPWSCEFNPEVGWEERWCDWCGFNSISEECPDHGHLARVPDEDVAA